MKLLGLLLLGFALALLQGEAVALWWAPSLPALVLSFVLLRLEGPGLWLKVLVLATGCATGSALPLGAWWLAAGLAALPCIGLRRVLFVRHPVVQALAAGWAAAGLLLSSRLVAALGTAPATAWEAPWMVGATLLAGPLAHPVLEVLARWLPGRALPPFPRDAHRTAAQMLE